MTPLPTTPDTLLAHERRLRVLVAAAILLFVAQAAVGFLLPRARLLPGLSSIWITGPALAVGLWLSLRVDRVAARLVIRARDRYVISGNVDRLLRDHLRVYLTVLAVLEGIGLLGLLVAVSGAGPRAALWFHGVAVLLAALAWPTDHKVRLYLDRAETLRRHRTDAGAAESAD